MFECRAFISEFTTYLCLGKLFDGEAAYLPSIVKRLRLEYQQVKDDEEELGKWENAKSDRYKALRNVCYQYSIFMDHRISKIPGMV